MAFRSCLVTIPSLQAVSEGEDLGGEAQFIWMQFALRQRSLALN